MKSIYIFLIFCSSIFSAFSQELERSIVDSTLSVKMWNEQFKKVISSDPLLAYSFAQNALDLARTINDSKGEAAALNNIGVFYKQRGNLQKALENYQNALVIQDSLQNEEGKALCLSNIGNIYSISGDYEKAQMYYNQALEIFEANNDFSRMVGLYSNIGNIYREQNNTQKAISYYKKSLDLFEQEVDLKTDFEQYPYSGLGNVYFESKDYENAIKYYKLSLEFSLKKNDYNLQASAYNDLASCYLATESLTTALDYAQKALSLATEYNNKPTEMMIYLNLSKIYYQLGNVESAYQNLINHYTLKNLINSEENKQSIRDLEIVYELESQQKQIELLKKEAEIKDLNLRNSRLFNSTITIILLLLIALSVLIYMKYSQNIQAKKQLQAQNKEISKSRDILEIQKKIIEDKNQSMTDSILYAKSLQNSILKSSDLSNSFPHHFIYFRPKDLVSGDFYWHKRIGEDDILAVVDCTGHGVAGAFMTVIANSLLNQVVVESQVTDPALILHLLDQKVIETLQQDEVATNNHGMDISIVKISTVEKKVIFAGAKRPIIYFDNQGMKFIKGNVYSIGEVYSNNTTKKFTRHEIPIANIQNIYLFTDGFADQFGEQVNKKYMIKRFKELIEKIQNQSLAQQGNSLAMEMKRWMGSLIQTDDMLVIGIRINNFNA